MPRKLWGQEVAALPGMDAPETPDFRSLTKKCRSLLEAAHRNGRVTPKASSASQFGTLVSLGLLTHTGEITATGKSCWENRGSPDE